MSNPILTARDIGYRVLHAPMVFVMVHGVVDPSRLINHARMIFPLGHEAPWLRIFPATKNGSRVREYHDLRQSLLPSLPPAGRARAHLALHGCKAR